MNKIETTIIMPVFNTWKYLSESIESILNQDYKDFEFIIIDDYSTDESREIIEKFEKQDKRIIFLKNNENKWIWYTRNKWLEIAKWDFIANFDSDDIAKNNRLSSQINILKNNDKIDIIGANIEFIDKKWVKLYKKTRFPEKDYEIKKSMPLVCSIANNSVVIRKKCFIEMWWYDKKARVAEDYLLWMKFSQKYTFYNNPEYLVYYRIHWENSIIKEWKAIFKDTIKDFKQKIKLIFPLNFWVFKFMIYSIFSYSFLFIILKFKTLLNKCQK